MRWKLLRRRFSASAPRMIVRSHLPWPLRWVVIALVFGFSASVALWAFELGKDIAGLDRDAKEELAQLRQQAAVLKSEHEKALAVAHTAESLLKTERAAQERLAQQLRETEAANLTLKEDLGFFERLMPSPTGEGLAVRALHAQAQGPGQLRYQMLLMQSGKATSEFSGRYELTLGGTLDGRPWTLAPASGAQPVQMKLHARLEGMIDHPPSAVVKTLQVRITDRSGAVRATHQVRL
ncbi:MAG: DUF6776 family protein [Aquabacterium sp.]